MNHPRAEYFDPARSLAYPAALSAAFRAGNVDLDAWLGKGEEGGTEFNLGVGAVYFPCKLLESALKVAHCNALVYHKALDLMENGGMGGVHIVGAVNSAGADHTDGRLAVFPWCVSAWQRSDFLK